MNNTRRSVPDTKTGSAIPAQTALLDPEPESSFESSQPTAQPTDGLAPRKRRSLPSTLAAKRFAPNHHEDHVENRQAELFYLQKQIQLQTQMIFVLEDGQRVQGVIEWYDRNSIKVRGKSRVLIYKTAIKYLYKLGEIGLPPEK